jgi:medium-chain acyl-[acyl-carrier-protein] hydrolase
MKDSANEVYKQTFRLHSYEVDRRGVARPDVLLAFMLDSAWGHTKDTDFSYSELKREGKLWVLSRFLGIFYTMPKWDDEITVETWSKGTDGLFGLRDFVVYSHSGERLISATSAWLIIDRKTSRIQRIDYMGKSFPTHLGKSELDIKLGKIDPKQVEGINLEDDVRYSDLDVNGHVNSAKYLLWIFDSFPVREFEKKDLESIELNFLSEAKLDDTIYVSSSNEDKDFYCEVRRKRDSVELCRAKVKFE